MAEFTSIVPENYQDEVSPREKPEFLFEKIDRKSTRMSMIGVSVNLGENDSTHQGIEEAPSAAEDKEGQ